MRVSGIGPKPCQIMLIGEAPGEQEDRTGKPFQGASGQELTRYLERININRSDIYITNLVKTRPPNNTDPTQEMIDADDPELLQELLQVDPKIVVCAGRIATRRFLPDADMESAHAIPQTIRSEETGLEFTVLPVYHPAAGLHSPELQSMLTYDFGQLRELLDGRLLVGGVHDEWAGREDYRDLSSDPRSLRSALDATVHVSENDSDSIVAIDTEGHPGSAWGLSISSKPGTGYVVRAGSLSIPAVQEVVNNSLVVLHNSLWDLPILQEMGITVPNFVDTMVMAYNLRIEPQGLKPLAKRHAGMVMHDYTDTMAPAEAKITEQYLRRAYASSLTPCPDCKGQCVIFTLTKKGADKITKCKTCKGEGYLEKYPPTSEVVWENGEPKLYTPRSVSKSIKAILESESAVQRKRWNDLSSTSRAPLEAIIGKMRESTMDDLPVEQAVWYSARDADSTLRVYYALESGIKRMALEGVLSLDCSVIPIIERMQANGFLLDVPYFYQLDAELATDMEKAERRLEELAGKYVNPGSGKQVADLLFRQLGLKSKKLTKSKVLESTDDKSLEGLRLDYASQPEAVEILDLIGDYREAGKLRGTYTIPLPKLVDPNGRIHTRLMVTRTETGRIASKSPNLANQPTRSDRGKKIRHGFVAPPGMLLGSWDLDQIEVRVLAHESGDSSLIQAFHEGKDVHRLTASRVFQIPESEVSSSQRSSAKSIKFGVIYGISSMGLLAQMQLRGLTYTQDDCQDLIDTYFKVYPGIQAYMEDRKAEARRFGYVRDYYGRIRYVTGIQSTIPKIREEAARFAGNFPIQSFASGIFKKILHRLQTDTLPMLRIAMRIEPLMQIYDSCELEFTEGFENVVDTQIVDAFSSTVDLKVPITANGKWGTRWSDCK